MNLFKTSTMISAALLMIGSTAFASPFSDFESALHAAYADYRSALFLTNANKQAEAVEAIGAFESQWAALGQATSEQRPQYADDPLYPETIAKVAEIATTASKEAAAGNLGKAHATLEEIREEIAKLHERNGIASFSDRMNAYHSAMEGVIATYSGELDAAKLGQLREDGAVLAYLAADLEKHPPSEASNPQFKALLKAVQASVAAVQQAARSADPAAASAAISGLKAPYSKLFLKFG